MEASMNLEGTTSYCSNCKRDIADANFVMHELHCSRNIALCKTCEEPVPRAEMDSHMDEFHTLVPCSKCGTRVERPSMGSHEDNECSKRLVRCSYCEVDKMHHTMAEHEQYCGSRTEQCPACQQYIMKQDQIVHEQTNCEYPQSASNGDSNNHQPQPGLNRLNTFAVDEISRITDLPMIRNDVRQSTEPKNETRWRTEKNRRAERSNVDRPMDSNVRTDEHANDLEEDNDIRSAMLNSLESQRPEEMDWLRSSFRPQLVPEKTRLPCEFCSQLCSSDELVQHQSGCAGSFGTESPVEVPARVELDRVSHGGPSHDPGSQDWIAHSFPLEFTSDDDVLLPCEFCNEPFLIDYLVQHQAVCDKNRTETPCPPRPNNNRTRSETSPPVQRALRRQMDPNVFDTPPEAPKVGAKRTLPSSRGTYQGQGASQSSGAASVPGPLRGLQSRHRPNNDSNLTRSDVPRRRSTSDSSAAYKQPSFVTTAPRRTAVSQRTTQTRTTPNRILNPVAGTSSEMTDVSNRMDRSSLEPTIQPRNNLRPRRKSKPEN